MSIGKSPSELLKSNTAYTYDDVLMVPQRSEVKSRKDPSLQTKLTQKITLEMPFISANMDTVTEHPMMIAMNQLGGIGILHRFMSIEDQVEEVKKAKAAGVQTLAASIGVTEDEQKRAHALVAEGVQLITIDIAHGHSVHMMDTVKWLKDTFQDKIEVIAGNVATPEGTLDLIEAGADCVKVGIGPGSMCTTRMITGFGVPQLSAVLWCAQAASEKNIPIIADGGIKTSGDIVKAIGAGAQTVMLGSLLSGCLETPGPIHFGKKHYRGMASKAAQVSWRGNLPKGMAPEGEATTVPVKGHVSDVINELAGGLRSGMSYANATSLEELQKNSRYLEMSGMGYMESIAHGVKN
ncbi:guanosine monophosphate reductase [bacterium]|nr:guanosine monophosphate reductase [bacterium]